MSVGASVTAFIQELWPLGGPLLPQGMWQGQVSVAGDATGGTSILNIDIAPNTGSAGLQRPYLINVEQLSVWSDGRAAGADSHFEVVGAHPVTNGVGPVLRFNAAMPLTSGGSVIAGSGDDLVGILTALRRPMRIRAVGIVTTFVSHTVSNGGVGSSHELYAWGFYWRADVLAYGWPVRFAADQHLGKRAVAARAQLAAGVA